MPTCITCLYMIPTGRPFICKCGKLLEKSRNEKNLLKKAALYLAGINVFVDQEKPCKEAVISLDGGN